MSLLAPLFLLGLLAAIVPWWLHRLSTDRPPLQDFASSMFLEASESASSRQTRLRYLRLLSLRILLLAALAFLFAEPVIKQLRLPGLSATRHVIVLDNSLSQSHSDRWTRTQSITNDILDAAAPSDQALIIAANSRFVQSGGDSEQDTSLDSARTNLASLQPTLRRLDFGRIANRVEATISDSPLPVHLHFVSDLQATAMPERFTDLAVDGVQNLDIYSTAQDTDGNIAISASLVYAADDRANVTVIANNHNIDTSDYVVTVSTREGTLDQTTLSIPKNSSKVHRFSGIDTSTANGQLTIAIEPQSNASLNEITADNQWQLAVPDGKRIEIPVLTGTSKSSAFTYVAAALESDPRYTARLINGDSFSATDAGSLLLVPDASVLSDRAVGRLRQYLSGGGNALIIPGDNPHGTQARQLLGLSSISTSQSATLQSTNRSNNRQITSAEKVKPTQTISTVDSTHPVTASLTANWRSLSIQRYLPLNVSATDRRIVDLGNGDALLFERTSGDGKVMLLSSPINTSWNNLAIDPLFVAFLVRSVEYLSGSTGTNLDRNIGEILTLPPGVQLLDPAGNTVRELSDLGSRDTIELRDPGVYRIRSAAGTQALSVNPDARESSIASIDDTTIAQWKALSTSANRPAESAGANSDPQKSSKNFWQWLLPIVVLVALLESLYSHRHLWIRREA